MTITREQVERAIEGMRDDVGAWSVLPSALGENWVGAVPADVRLAWQRGEWGACIAALTRWRDELVAAETPRKAPDDTAPERLRDRREALGLSRRGMAVIAQRHETGDVHWEPEDIRICEIPANPPHRASGRATYAAALIAAEAERARPAIDPLAYTDSPAWDEPPVRKPAPEVVDVPQPEPWHARLVRLAQEAQDASRACADAEAAFTKADAERETARKARAAAREACHVKRQALTAATTAAAIIRDAQQPAPVQPTRPEPRYKVGDWVADNETGARGVISRAEWSATQGQWRYDMGSVDYPEAHLTPAIDPALHETARKTVAWLRAGARGEPPSRYYNLPGHGAYVADVRDDDNARWAAQLERLLGDAP